MFVVMFTCVYNPNGCRTAQGYAKKIPFFVPELSGTNSAFL